VFGLDSQLAHLSDGTTLAVVLGIAMLLGLRHASDPDHLAAVTTLVAGDGRGQVRRAGRLGFTWGLGHATSLLALGLPIVLYRAYLPESVQRGAETTVGLVIVALGVMLLVRWRRGLFDPDSHRHVHARSPLQAYAIGLVHGTGGSAGVGVLLLAAIPSHTLAIAALALFAVGTAVSMALLSTGFGLTLRTGTARRSLARIAPVLGMLSLAFGAWYTLGALAIAPYPL
jgi:high-affinity nickel permease